MLRVSDVVLLLGSFGAAAAIATFAHLLLNLSLRRRITGDQHEVSERVAVLIPMRNEEQNAAAVLADVLAQVRVPHLQVLACDDNSSDGTLRILERVAASEPRVTVLRGAEPAAGWLGKPWACWQLREAAGGADILVFIDADVRLAPTAIADTITTLRRHRLALLSPFPRQVYSGFWLSLFQPLLQWSILSMLPLRLMEHRARTAIGRSLAAGNGQFLTFDAAAYDRAGGHAAVRGEVVEDVMIARAVKKSGDRVALTTGTGIASCKMYDDNEQFVQGYLKSLWKAFGNPIGGLAVAAMFLLEYLLPLAGMASTAAGTSLWWLCATGVIAGVVGRVITATATKDALWPALLHPLSILLFAWLMVESVRRKRQGRLQWRGRTI